jgi:hypothetical protein
MTARLYRCLALAAAVDVDLVAVVMIVAMTIASR